MHDNRSHPLLEQVPLTVSPFVHLPRATTLPYRYKTMPSALPPSIIEAAGPGGAGSKPAYVVSQASSSAAHPDDIIASCRALREHVGRMQADADAELRQLEQRIQARDLAEKRRVAPGWLDSEDRLLVPEKKDSATATTTATATAGKDPGRGDGSASQPSEMAASVPEQFAAAAAAEASRGGVTGEALDQAFGSMKIRSG
ncbi:hypothetical protein SCUCBS95973_002673 [Sporothrix curviconia]|uniref:Uncharacterized protein n=1 Tax=Sporothrix curviconia TaxID=1260050 RepID=A0ABP0B9V8_9PEZI